MNVNATNFRKELYKYLDTAIEFNNIITINTKKGNVVVINEEEYNGLIETLMLYSIPNMKEKIVEGLNTSLNNCIPENEVEW